MQPASPLLADTAVEAMRGWTWWTWALHLLGAAYVLLFLVFFFRFRAAERRALSEGGAAVARYNRMLRGVPNAFYAKMLGRRRLEAKPEASDGRSVAAGVPKAPEPPA